MEDDDIDCQLIAADELLWSARIGLHRAVTEAREAGWTWAAIGEVLGVTRQSAQERFGKPLPNRSYATVSGRPLQTESLW